MWPIGYIVASPLSPLQVERELPARNWRDPFEDLIAIENGGQMMSKESRERETEDLVGWIYQRAHDEISHINEVIGHSTRFLSFLQRLRSFFIRRDELDMVSYVDKEQIPQMRTVSQELLETGQGIISTLKEFENTDGLRRSDRMKTRGHWIASLVSNGALPGWDTQLCDSAGGHHWSIYKKVAPEESVGHTIYGDGLEFTEEELLLRFERGIPMQVGSPAWTSRDEFPKYEFATENQSDESTTNRAQWKNPPLRHSIYSQTTEAKRTKLSNGLFSTQVLIRNSFTDGRTEEEEIVDNTGKVFEEVSKAFAAFKDRKHSFLSASIDQAYEEEKALLRAVEMVEEGD